MNTDSDTRKATEGIRDIAGSPIFENEQLNKKLCHARRPDARSMPGGWYETDVCNGVMVEQLGGPKWEHGQCGLSVSRSAELLIQDRKFIESLSGVTLDVGCGTGAVVAVLADRGMVAAGMDLYPETVQLAERNIPTSAIFQEDWRKPEILDLPGFDNVIACDPCESIPELVEFIRSVWSGNGVAIICDPGRFKKIEGMKLYRTIENDEFATNVWSLKQ